MNSGQSLFSQLIDHLPQHQFRQCVQRYAGNYRVRSFSCWDQFLSMTFAQLSYRESLRDIVVCLRSQERRLYHLGIRGRISRSTLADANESRDWRIYADFAQGLIQEARRLYLNEDLGLDGQHGLCAGFHDYRSVHGAVSVGTFFLDPTRSETTYAAGPARPDSCFPAHYTGTHPRRQHSRPAYSRGGRFLRDGSWLSQFRTVVSLDLAGRLLCHPSPQELPFCSSLLASGRQEQRRAVRSDHRSALVLFRQRLSRPAPSASATGMPSRKSGWCFSPTTSLFPQR
jgi:hypothetical protein